MLINMVLQILESYFVQFFEWEFVLLMAIVVFLVAMQYKKAESARAAMFGTKPAGYWKDTFFALLLGLAGGLTGSILGSLSGIPLSGSGNAFVLLLLIAAALMMINPRFICFAYAGGIISLSNIIFGVPSINVYQILALVALLHLIESLLIFFSGHLGAIPTFFRDRSGQVKGGFTLQKFWPIPLVVLFTVGYSDSQSLIGEMPAWWPLVKSGVEHPLNSFALVSVVAGLGYGDLAITHTPYEKRKISAVLLSLYSITLFLLAVFAQHFNLLIWVAALFSPLGHELVIHIGRKIEMAGKPRYLPSKRGARVLDVVPGSLAYSAGIRSGDILISVGRVFVYSHIDLNEVVQSLSGPIEVEFLHGKHQVFKRGLIDFHNTKKPLGLLLVSQINKSSSVEINAPGVLSGILSRYRGKNSR